MTRNKTTSAAVTAIKQWVNMYGRPKQIRCDAGPAYRDQFIADMKTMGILVSHSSAYSPMSNSHAERFVRSLKTLLRKCGSGISQLELDELILCVNSQVQKAGQASSLDRFFGKSILTQIPNSLNMNFNWKSSMDARQRLREERVLKPEKGNKNLYQVGQKVTLQNPHTGIWDIGAEVTGIRTAPDGKILSYNLLQENGTQTTRHRVYIRAALPDKVVNDGEAEDDDTGTVEHDDGAEIIHEPVSSRLRPRAKVAAIVEVDESVEKESASLENVAELAETNQGLSNEDSLALSQTSKAAANSNLVTAAFLNLKYLTVWSWSNRITKYLEMPSSSSCSCSCLLTIYAVFATLLWMGLAAILGATHSTPTACNPIVSNNEGQVEIINDNTVEVDFFNSHSAVKSENKYDEKTADSCSQSCFHYFTKIEIGELISFLLLGYLLLANWTRISMWCHKKWKKISAARAERESALAAARRLQEEERIQSEVLERLELQRVAVIPVEQELAGGGAQAPAIRVDVN